MGRTLEARLVSRKFEGPHHEALLNLILATNHVRSVMDESFRTTGLTSTQYNVLRILNGAYPNGYPRGEISRRMLDRAPDLTRLIDRLVRRGWVQRARTGEDGRQSIATITPKGRQLVASLNAKVRATTRIAVEKRLSATEAKALSRLCEKLYADD